jgi:hypothetical protein
MATGTGTEADPRIVYNWDELVDAFQNHDYIELGADINAPQKSVSLAGGRERVNSLDGKGFSIINLFTLSGSAISINGHAGYVFQPLISNISFVNINCQADTFFNFNNVYSVRMENVVFSGCVYGNQLVHSDGNNHGYFNYCGGNIHTNNGQFALFKSDSLPDVGVSCNSWRVDYGSVLPDSGYPLLSNMDINNSLFQFRASQNGTIAMGNCRYCAFIGDGAIKISGSTSPNIVSNTLVLDNNSTGTNYIVTDTNMRDVQYLYDLGFPVSGVI